MRGYKAEAVLGQKVVLLDDPVVRQNLFVEPVITLVEEIRVNPKYEEIEYRITASSAKHLSFKLNADVQ